MLDAGVAAASSITVDCRFAGVEGADPERFVGWLAADFRAVCALSRVGRAAVTSGVGGVPAFRPPCDGTAPSEGADAAGTSVDDVAVRCSVGTGAAGGLAGAAVASAARAPVSVGVARADAVLALLDGVDLVCAPPEFCTTSERWSGVEASLDGEVESDWRTTGFGTDVELDEERAVEVDESVDDVGPVDGGLAADSDDELEADDERDDELEESDVELEELDVELEELESLGSANATAGVFATAAPTPNATANMPTRAMRCAFTGPALGGQAAERPPDPP